MNEQQPLTPDEREELVSYLDEELDEEAQHVVEARLANSPETRREAEALKRTWELLDFLPRPQASETFTSRTLERLETAQLRQAHGRRLGQWLGRAAWAASLLAAGLISFWILYQWPRPESPEPTAEDLQILEHRDYWHYYEKVDSLEFLKELERSGLFSEES